MRLQQTRAQLAGHVTHHLQQGHENQGATRGKPQRGDDTPNSMFHSVQCLPLTWSGEEKAFCERQCERSEERGGGVRRTWRNSQRGSRGRALPLLANPSQTCMKLVVSSLVEQDEVEEVEGFGQEIARAPIWSRT